ncbi:hypothetical protein BLNAU_8449 [Blattamonas nauphoetae]|uniref:Uncharacterized protein n=1 Tax=Blattamonas nauphoetae TaxID=2049346 RepID=A0ABQ9XYQ3_9EUKA|nr:hypothetical protein BLNAU_8449 [Blattamonas nauphoetae]
MDRRDGSGGWIGEDGSGDGWTGEGWIGEGWTGEGWDWEGWDWGGMDSGGMDWGGMDWEGWIGEGWIGEGWIGGIRGWIGGNMEMVVSEADEIEDRVLKREKEVSVREGPALDDNLKAKAVNILQSVNPMYSESADAFLSGFGQTTKESSRNFVQSIVVVVSSVNLVIITAAMELLRRLIFCCSPKVRLALVKTDLIPQIIITLNPQSLFFTEAVDIHICLIQIIFHSLELATPYYFSRLGIVDGNEQQGVHETVLKHVVAPSEKYVCHLCVNRFSIIDGRLSETFLELLAHLLDRCPYYQRTSEFVLLSLDGRHTLLRRHSRHACLLICGRHCVDGWMVTIGGKRQKTKSIAISTNRSLLTLQSKYDGFSNIFRHCSSANFAVALTTSAMKMLRDLIWRWSDPVYFALIKADLIPHLINTLNPQSLSFAEGVDIHTATPYFLTKLGFEDRNEQETVHEIILKHVMVPSEKYICHLCVNRYSINDGEQSRYFLEILAQLLRVCPSYPQAMHSMNTAQQEWNEKGGEARQIGKTVHEMLRMEGFEDVIEEKLQNDQNELSGRWIVAKSIQWNNLQGMNLSRHA